MQASRVHGWGPHLGALIGYTAWVAALAIVCAARGHGSWVYELCLPTLLVGLGLGLATVASLELVRRAFPGQPSFFQRALWGRVLTDVGILLLLAGEWILPKLRQDDSIMTLLASSTGGATSVPPWIPILLLAVGCGLTLATARRVLAEMPT